MTSQAKRIVYNQRNAFYKRGTQMAVYIITMIRQLVDLEKDIDDSSLYTREMAIDMSHCKETLEKMLDTFEESFLTTQFAKDGWVLVGNATVTILTKKFYNAYNRYFDDDIRSQKSKSHLSVVR